MAHFRKGGGLPGRFIRSNSLTADWSWEICPSTPVLAAEAGRAPCLPIPDCRLRRLCSSSTERSAAQPRRGSSLCCIMAAVRRASYVVGSINIGSSSGGIIVTSRRVAVAASDSESCRAACAAA